MSWSTSKDAVPDHVVQVTVYDEESGERVATVFKADAVPVVAAAPDLLAQALRLRGAHYVRTGQWKLAAADYSQSVTVDPKSNSIDWMTAAALWAYAADADQHRLHCRSQTGLRVADLSSEKRQHVVRRRSQCSCAR